MIIKALHYLRLSPPPFNRVLFHSAIPSLLDGTIQIDPGSSVEISAPDGALHVRAMVRSAPSQGHDLLPTKEVILYALDCQGLCGDSRGTDMFRGNLNSIHCKR
jgi:hypothetical protein